MSASTNPPADAELLRLLDFYQQARVDTYRLRASSLVSDKARARLLQYIAQHYVRRDRLVSDEWDNLAASADELPEESPGPPIVAGPLSRVPVRIRLTDGAEDRTTWPLRAIVGDRRYGGDTSGRYNVLDCGHESSVLHGGTPERMPDGGYGKRCRRCAAVIDHNEEHDYDVRD